MASAFRITSSNETDSGTSIANISYLNEDAVLGTPWPGQVILWHARPENPGSPLGP